MKSEGFEKLNKEIEALLSQTGSSQKSWMSTRKPPLRDKEVTFEDKLKQSEVDLHQTKVDGMKLDIKLKEATLGRLFLFLGLETIVVFIFTFLQGYESDHFHLEEWSFKLMLSATILQISFMLSVAVKHLFPEKN